jgi:hypothetical protein
MSFQVLPKKGLSRAQVEAAIDEGRLPWLSGTFHDITDHYQPQTKATTTVVANTLYGTPFRVDLPESINAIALPVFTAGAGGTVARVGLYTMDTTLLLPGALITEATSELATSSTGVKLGTVDEDLDPHTWYWAAAVFSGTPAINNYSVLNANLFGLVTADGSCLPGVTASHTYGALPATFPTATRIATPLRLPVRAA